MNTKALKRIEFILENYENITIEANIEINIRYDINYQKYFSINFNNNKQSHLIILNKCKKIIVNIKYLDTKKNKNGKNIIDLFKYKNITYICLVFNDDTKLEICPESQWDSLFLKNFAQSLKKQNNSWWQLKFKKRFFLFYFVWYILQKF